MQSGRWRENDSQGRGLERMLIDSSVQPWRGLPFQDSKGAEGQNLEKNTMAAWNQNDQADRLENEMDRTIHQSKR
jgi:hypothetical protein